MESERWIPLAATLAMLAMVGCSGSSLTGSPDGGGTGGQVVWGDAGSGVDGQAVACATRSGYFACGPGVCSRAIQACTQGSCEWYGDIEPSCGRCPTCACLRASPMNISTCDDDGAGGITFALYTGAEGDPCKSDTDCSNAECMNGVCHCLPAGASLPDSGTFACCSAWEQAGACTAQAGSACTTRVPDCNGGTCSGGTCTCVGSGGYCNVDADCCAGTTQCVQEQCQ